MMSPGLMVSRVSMYSRLALRQEAETLRRGVTRGQRPYSGLEATTWRRGSRRSLERFIISLTRYFMENYVITNL